MSTQTNAHCVITIPGGRTVAELAPSAPRVVLGRAPECDIIIAWDSEVSRTHAWLERVGAVWMLVDDGISRNGTFLNGERVMSRRRLSNDDIIRVGRTDLRFQVVDHGGNPSTVVAAAAAPIELSPAQRRVLVALARPYRAGSDFPTPASNKQIADELSIGVEAVKGHLRALFGKFALGGLPQNQKRARLVEVALGTGTLSLHELD